MGSLEEYRQIICSTITEYAQIAYAYGDIQRHTVFDTKSDRYLLMILGWEDVKQVHGCLIHVEIIEEKIWIHQDGTEDGIANEFLNAGIPKDRIVLGFRSPSMRKYTEFAVA